MRANSPSWARTRLEVIFFFELATRTDSLPCFLSVIILELCKCVCVCKPVSGGEQCNQIIRWFFQASVSDCLNPRLCRFLLCILPSPSRFPNPRHSHLTGSSAHLGVSFLRPRISDCHMRSFPDLDVAHLRPSIPIAHPDFLSLTVAVLLHVHLPTDPIPPFSFLEPPHIPPLPPSFIPCLPCTYLK